MAPIFSRNAILVGTIDSFCLVCDTYLKNDRDTVTHITKPVHQKNLEAIQYVEEFKADGIKKIKNKYFCELCNELLSLLAKVRLHITELAHNDNKKNNAFKRVGNSIIAFGEAVINEQSWHGLNENSCALCNTEYDNEEIHRNEPAHILNLIQTEWEFDDSNNVYRKVIDKSSFHCLICNMVIGLDSLKSHFVDNEHRQQYQICCDAKTFIETQVKSIKEVNNLAQEEVTKTEAAIKEVINERNENNKISNIVKEEVSKPETIIKDVINETNKHNDSDNINNLAKEEVTNPVANAKEVTNETSKNNGSRKINIAAKEEDTKPEVKKINEVLNVSSKTNEQKSTKAILKNVSTTCEYLFDENSENRICKTLGCKDYITLDENKKTWCILCDWVMDPYSVNGHLNGRHHQLILKLHKKRAEKMRNKYINDKHKDEVPESPTTKALEDNDKILDHLNEFQKNDININFESNTVVCKKCTMDINFKYEAIENHISEHKKKPTKKESKRKTIDAGAAKVSEKKTSLFTAPVLLDNKKSNTETLKTNTEEVQNNQETCLDEYIEITLPHTLNNDKEHVQKSTENSESVNEVHVFNAKMKKSKALKHAKVPSKMFIKSMTAVENMLYKDVVINGKYCINFFSLCMMTKLPGLNDFRCHTCDKNLILDEFENHIITAKHTTATNETPVIIYDDTELIREVRPGVFHCGYCNSVTSSWEDMETHLKSSLHKESKTSALWRLEQYKADINRNNYNRVASEQLIMNELITKYF